MIRMSFTSLDLIKGLLEANIFGSSLILALFVILFIIALLLVSRAFPEVVFLIPLPLIVTLTESGLVPLYWKAIIYIIAGLYLAVVILILIQVVRR